MGTSLFGFWSSRSARRARLAVAMGTIVVLGAVPVTAHAAAWTTGPAFGITGTAVGGDLVEGPDSSATAVWTDGDGVAPYVAHAQHAGPTDALSAPIALGVAAAAPYGVPHAAASPGGTTAVAWLGYDSVADRYPLHLVLLDAAGAKVRDTTVATLTSDEAQQGFSAVAVDAAGTATVVWAAATSDASVASLHAARVTAAGVRSAPVTLGSLALSGQTATPMRVATTPAGVSWVAWPGTDGRVDVTRLNAGGAIDAATTAVSTPGRNLGQIAVAASAAGGTVAWEELLRFDNGVPVVQLEGARLPVSGGLTATGFETPSYAIVPLSGVRDIDVAIGPDGAVTAAWEAYDSAVSSIRILINRFAPGQTTAPAPQVAEDGGGGGAYPASPKLVVTPGGALIASWLKIGGPGLGVAVRSVGSDGTLSPTTNVIPVSSTAPAAIPQLFAAQGDDSVNGIVGVGSGGPFSGSGSDPWTAKTFRFDAIPPVLTVDVPAGAAPLTPVTFTATVADPATAPVTWEFGDGSSATGTSVTHVYAAAGTYTVRATATDENGNQAVVTRTIVVATPPPAVVGPTPNGSGTTPTTNPAPAPGPVAVPAIAAGLRVSRATRTATRVTVSGTIARTATGRVTVVYAQRLGRRTIKVTKTVKVSKGRWTITIRLPSKLAKGRAARVRGTVTVTWAGTKAIKKATARRTVALARTRTRAKAKR
jgi:PKD repeat protein